MEQPPTGAGSGTIHQYMVGCLEDAEYCVLSPLAGKGQHAMQEPGNGAAWPLVLIVASHCKTVLGWCASPSSTHKSCPSCCLQQQLHPAAAAWQYSDTNGNVPPHCRCCCCRHCCYCCCRHSRRYCWCCRAPRHQQQQQHPHWLPLPALLAHTACQQAGLPASAAAAAGEGLCLPAVCPAALTSWRQLLPAVEVSHLPAALPCQLPAS